MADIKTKEAADKEKWDDRKRDTKTKSSAEQETKAKPGENVKAKRATEKKKQDDSKRDTKIENSKQNEMKAELVQSYKTNGTAENEKSDNRKDTAKTKSSAKQEPKSESVKSIKTKDASKNDIKVLDKADDLARAVRTVSIRTKDQIENLSDDGQVTPEEYANDKIKYMAEGAAEDAGRLAKKGVKKTYDGGKKLTKDIKRRRNEKKAADEPIKQTAKSTGKQTAKTVEHTIKTQQRNIKTAEQTSRAAVKTTKETAKKAVKTAEQTAKASKKAAEVAAKTAQRAAQAAKDAAVATYRAAVVAVKATVAAVKAIAAGISKLIAAIAAGGWVALVIILVICVIGLIVGSCFGIFFSGDDTGTGMSMRTAITDINNEYQQKITDIRNGTAYDVLEMSGSRAVWPEVLAVYAVKTTTDPDNPQEVASMDDSKRQLLKDIFWTMNSISKSTQTKTENIIVETDDGNGNITETTEQQTRTYLYITVFHKTVDEMATQYGFNAEQKQQLTELLSEDKQKIWSQVLYGFSTGNDTIVQIALTQIGNVGGEPYWSWYGFNSRVEWCACFVSWCANEAGYIEIGVIPKFAGCCNGVDWFRDRGQFQDNSYTPNPGDIIFFDWDSPNGSSGPQDGLADHVGIVEKVENGIVYTVEGNTSDSCRERQYSVGYYEILGYAIPAY